MAAREDGDRVRCHVAASRFVAGQSQAVVELVSGRTNLPATTWQPAAVAGVRGRPTLLSNAETWAQLGFALHVGPEAYRRLGTPVEPGTTLVTVTVPDRPPRVREVAFGDRVGRAVPELGQAEARHVLVGGFHGSWVDRAVLSEARLSVPGLRAVGAALGAGVVNVPAAQECPVVRTAAIVEVLAAESARQCGPCRFGLPRLSEAVGELAAGTADPSEVERLAAMVDGRGACAHPDGTARLVRSLLTAVPVEVAQHARGGCTYGEPVRPRRAGQPVAS